MSLDLAAPCPSCGGARLRVRALWPAVVRVLDGEPVVAPQWDAPVETVATYWYALECVDCGARIASRESCPRCDGKGGVARALDGIHGLEVPTACPRCDHGELALHADVRMRVEYLNGAVVRRVADAGPGEAGFQVRSIGCPSCEASVAELTSRCPTCGRSSLLKKMR